MRIVSKTRAACNLSAVNAYESYRYFSTPSASSFLSYSSVCARRCNCVLGSQLSSADVGAPRFVPRPSINLTAASRPLRLRRMRRWLSPPPPESVLQSLSPVRLRDPMGCCTPGLPVHHQLRSLLKLMSIESVMPSSHLFLCRPLLLLPSVFPSIRVSSKESALCLRWSKYWSFSFSISPSNEYSGLISFRMNRFDLLAVQGTLDNFLQHRSSKASIVPTLSFLYSPTLTSI